jgi:hypothetical protein
VFVADRLLDLGQNLALYKMHVDELKEQDVNARAMPKQMFDRLSQTIGRDGRLESLPFGAKTDKGFEIISGHHRTRAARASNVQDIHVVVDESGLNRSQISSKQLAHNSIAGEDNLQLLSKIYEDIDDVEDKLEAFIDPDEVNQSIETVGIDSVDVGLAFRTALLVFMPWEKEKFEEALDSLEDSIGADVEQLYVADIARMQDFKNLVRKVGDEYDIRSFATTMALMAEIVMEHLGYETPDPEPDDRVHLRDVVGQVYIPADAADVISRAVDKMADAGDLSKKNRWQALEWMASDYLGGS